MLFRLIKYSFESGGIGGLKFNVRRAGAAGNFVRLVRFKLRRFN